MEELTRTQILMGNYHYPSDLIKLRPTKHFMNRLEERGIGLQCIPTLVRVERNNIHSGKTEDGINLKSVVVRLKYSSKYYIFLCFNPFDGALKTLWFRNRNIYADRRRKRRAAARNSQQAV